jgi:hypothetical protein
MTFDRSAATRLVALCLALAACVQPGAAPSPSIEPAVIEPIAGTDLHRIALSTRAAERLGIQTEPVRALTVDGVQRPVIAYSAVLYDASGATWAYAEEEPLVFLRHAITVISIDGDVAVLSAGPPTGALVVTVGVAELFGTESDIGH